MRVPVIAGNWKMHKTIPESVALARELASSLAVWEDVERVVAPTFLALAQVADVLRGTGIAVSAQDAHYEAQGAFTSQVSSAMLIGLASHVIIGHSECRAWLGETDERVNRKLRAALACGLVPIVAVGENLEQNETGRTHQIVSAQVRAALQDVAGDEMHEVVLAYEPVWAIGTGRNADADVARDVIGGCIRPALTELFGNDLAQRVRILYGGSVKPDNMAQYMGEQEIDGALVGGASLNARDFSDLVAIAAREKSGGVS